jgi:type VI secretion system protein ImpK
MSDRVYAVCADVLMLAATFPLTPSLAPAGELRQRLQTALDALVGRGRAAGIAEADLADIRFALVAFLDEQILKANWPGRAEWMNQPLQLVLYNQYTAGETFFLRLRSLLAEGNRADALLAYYLCLALGFRGQYGASPDSSALTSFMQAALPQLTRGLPRSDKLGPNAVPSERAKQTKNSNAALIAFVVAALLVSAAVLFGLQRLVSSEVRAALEAMPLEGLTQAR